MKKLLSLFLAAMMLVSMAACSGEKKVEEKVDEAVAAVEEKADEAVAAVEEKAADVVDAVTEAVDGSTGTGLAGKKVAVVVKATGNPFNERQIDGFKLAIEELGGEAIVKAPDSPTVEAQLAMIEELIIQKVDGIALAANDFDALQNVLERAKSEGIPVVTFDSAVNASSRITHVNQADSQMIGQTLVEAAFDLSGGGGEFAILSATSQAANQNTWIEYMEETLKDPKYADLKLVKIAYGDDLRDKSTSETEGLLKSYPDLKVIVAPTTVGIAAAAKVLQDKNVIDSVKITGLGLPSEMAEYIKSGACPYMYLWNPIDLGYLAAYTLSAAVNSEITGATGDAFSAGHLNDYVLTDDPAGGSEVLMGAPFKFEASNIDDWSGVY